MKYLSLIICAGAALVLGSCSLLEQKVSRPKASQQVLTTQTLTPANRPEVRAPLPEPPRVAGARPDSATLTGGRWLIAGVDDKQVVAEDDAPYIDFESGTGRFYASDGCNIVNGDYLLRTDGRLVFSNVLSTMKYCPGNEYDVLIAKYVNDGSQLYVDTQRIGQDTYLYLRDGEDRVVMTLRRHNMEFLNGNWTVTSIGGTRIDDPECNIFFDIAEGKVHGNTGCNFFNGDIYIDPNRSNALDLSNMGTTRMACPNGDREQRMLVALETTASAIAGNNAETVLLLNSEGHEVMTLRRAPLRAE